jgi:DNA-binding transcriptional MerR regulator
MTGPMTLAELADAAATPARTIRFYISRGLLAGPDKAGRGAVYGERHLARLEQIKQLQTDGLTLSAIAHRLNPTGPAPAASPEAWWRYPLTDDVVVLARADVSPWRTKQIREAIDHLAARLKEQDS